MNTPRPSKQRFGVLPPRIKTLIRMRNILKNREVIVKGTSNYQTLVDYIYYYPNRGVL